MLLVAVLDDLASILADAPDGQEISNLRARVHAVQDGLLKESLIIAPLSTLDLLTLHKAPAEIQRFVEAKPAQSLRKTRTCPVCDALSRAAFDFFVALEGSLIKEAQVRNEFASVRGLCNLHTWQFQNAAAPQDISVGYVPLVVRTAFTKSVQ